MLDGSPSPLMGGLGLETRVMENWILQRLWIVVPSQSVFHGSSLTRRSIPLPGIPLYPLYGQTVIC